MKRIVKSILFSSLLLMSNANAYVFNVDKENHDEIYQELLTMPVAIRSVACAAIFEQKCKDKGHGSIGFYHLDELLSQYECEKCVQNIELIQKLNQEGQIKLLANWIVDELKTPISFSITNRTTKIIINFLTFYMKNAVSVECDPDQLEKILNSCFRDEIPESSRKEDELLQNLGYCVDWNFFSEDGIGEIESTMPLYTLLEIVKKIDPSINLTEEEKTNIGKISLLKIGRETFIEDHGFFEHGSQIDIFFNKLSQSQKLNFLAKKMHFILQLKMHLNDTFSLKNDSNANQDNFDEIPLLI